MQAQGLMALGPNPECKAQKHRVGINTELRNESQIRATAAAEKSTMDIAEGRRDGKEAVWHLQLVPSSRKSPTLGVLHAALLLYSVWFLSLYPLTFLTKKSYGLTERVILQSYANLAAAGLSFLLCLWRQIAGRLLIQRFSPCFFSKIV